MPLKFKTKICMILMLLVFFLPTLAGCSAVSANNSDYTISNYDIQVALQNDGSALITETVSFDTRRNLKTFNFNIDYADSGSIQIDQINILNRQGTDGSTVDYEIKPLTSNASLNSNADYQSQDDGRTLNIQISVLTEAETTRTIQLVYRLTEVIRRNSDYAALIHRFFTSADDADIDQLNLTIKLPEPISEIEIWTLPVSLTEFSVSQPQDDLMQYHADTSRGNNNLLLYCIFSPERFTAAKPFVSNQTWEQMTAAAKKSANDLKFSYNFRDTISNLARVLLGLSILLCLFIYWFYDREGRAKFRHHYWHTLPEGFEPAVMLLLMNKFIPGRLILTILLDLVRRNILMLRGNIFTLKYAQIEQIDGLSTYEKHLLQFLFDKIASGQSISTAEIRQFARNKSTAAVFQSNYTQFRELLDIQIKNRGLIDYERALRGRILAWLASGCYLVISLVSIFYLKIPGGLLLLIPSAGMALYGWKIRRLSPVGRELYAMGQALKRTINDCDGIKIWAEPEFFANMLPFAVGIGLGGRLTENLISSGKTSKLSHSDYSLENYGIISSATEWSKQIETLSADLKVMESMLSASVLLSAGLHW